MLNKTEKVTITRDGYTIENKYEALIGYWTDILDCIETNSYYLMISEYSKRLIIISKKCLDDEQNEKLAEFLKKNVKEGDIVFTMGAEVIQFERKNTYSYSRLYYNRTRLYSYKPCTA